MEMYHDLPVQIVDLQWFTCQNKYDILRFEASDVAVALRSTIQLQYVYIIYIYIYIYNIYIYNIHIYIYI